MEEDKTNCFYATLERKSHFLWRPPPQETLKKRGFPPGGPQCNIHLEAPTQSHAFFSPQQRILLHGRPVVSYAALCSACSGTKPNKQDFPHSEQY